MEIEFNEYFKTAFELIEAGKNVFVTGRAGTGKSTFLTYFVTHTKNRAVVMAPTGVAAVNVQGQTIHSFFALAPGVTVSEARKEALNRKKTDLFEKVDVFVIDEVSMVRADLMDCIDIFLQTALKSKLAFGGKQVVFIGDLYQLPPVVKGEQKKAFGHQYASQYFFDSLVMKNLELTLVEFEKIYRQSDQKFIGMLNRIRNKTIDDSDLKKLNERTENIEQDDGFIHLVTTNKMAEEINAKKLSKIKEKEHKFRGLIEGNFSFDSLPTELLLKLKVGAQVMFVANDSWKKWVNGTIGTITKISGKNVKVQLASGKEVNVKPHAWEIFKYKYNQTAREIEKETVGAFTQLPLRLAWAITIHKSQGKTFDKVIIDIGKGTFTHGQMYVALSRCTTLNGMKIKTPIRKNDIWLDWKIVNFLTKYQYAQSEKTFSLADKKMLILQAIKNKQDLEIVYLKPNDKKSKRTITPIDLKQMEYAGRQFEGLEAYCHSKKDNRNFKIDRILEMKQK